MEKDEKRELNINTIKKIFILILSLIGFITTIKLMIIYIDSNFNPYALPSFCSINEFIDCDGVAQTIHSQFLGIPLAIWGMSLYIFIIFLIFADTLKKIKFLSFLEVFKNPLAYIATLGLISFFISILFLNGFIKFLSNSSCFMGCMFGFFSIQAINSADLQFNL